MSFLTKNSKGRKPQKYSRDYSRHLCKYAADKFDEWWDPERFDWRASVLLCIYLPDKFDIWWNPNKYYWCIGSGELCKYLPHKFDIWWDPNKFNWLYIDHLERYLPDKKEIWGYRRTIDSEDESDESLEPGDIWFGRALIGIALGIIGFLTSTILTIFIPKTLVHTMHIIQGISLGI
ncbi:MAG: hypothetical protein QXI16_03230, partial [Sulfolobaceae archaeon]